jgi:hypothetical protein
MSASTLRKRVLSNVVGIYQMGTKWKEGNTGLPFPRVTCGTPKENILPLPGVLGDALGKGKPPMGRGYGVAYDRRPI